MRKNHSTSPFSDPFDRRNYSSSRETPARNNLSTATLTDLQSQFSKSKNPTFSHERVSKLYTLFHDIKHAVYTATSRNNVESNGPASREKRVESIKQSLEEELLPQLIDKYPQLQYTFEGSHRAQTNTMAGIRQGGIVALVLIFSLLALQFRSYLQPFIIMAAIPFGLVGAVLGHLILGYNLSIISVLGLVALTGIVVNDSLILVDFINRARYRGDAIIQAVLESGVRRFRPIVLTTLTTFFGLLPMLFEQSLQARFLIPMAISLAFGVLFSTFVILILTPVLYVILEDFKGIFGRKTKKMAVNEKLV